MIRFARLARRPAKPKPEAAAPTDGEPPAAGCGWFDSSHELSAGLQVHEHRAAESDAALAALPLATWLDLQLSGWRGPVTESATPP
ncbi:MAG: hypothetical protein M3Y32_07035 [Pseudomonadota bacterium]|nr:hypothetical protein [Pseudomonadota bacterium]